MILNKYVFNPNWRWIDSILRLMGPFVFSRKCVRRWAHALWNLFIKTEEIQGWFGFNYDERSCEYRLLGLIPIMQFVSFTIWIYSNHDCTVINLIAVRYVQGRLSRNKIIRSMMNVFNLRVWSWLRTNAGGRLNTCKSSGLFREAAADGLVTRGNVPFSTE